MEPTYIAAIEIGSSHIRAAVGRVATDGDGALTVLGVEEEKAIDVVRYGAVQNVEEVSSRINKLKLKLENHPSIAPRKIKAVYVGLGGRTTMGSSARVERAYGDEIEINAEVMTQITEEARMQAFSDRTVVEVLPRQFVVDNLDITTPRGTFGRDIRADFNLITCKPAVKRNLERAISERQQLAIKKIYVRHTALAELVLTDDDRELGCMLADFGAETTTVSIYKGGMLKYLATLPIGSRCITRDVMTLGFTEERAEEIKLNVGDVGSGEQPRRKHDFDGNLAEVNDYVRARAGEIAANILEQAKYAGYTFADDLTAGIVMVGGGTRLRGFTQLLQSQQSTAKVRLGALPAGVRIADPRYQGVDALDVVAILNKASREAAECTEQPGGAATTAAAGGGGDYDPADGPGIIPRKGGKGGNKQPAKPPKEPKAPKEKKPKEKKPKGPSLADRIKDSLGRLFQEPDDTDYDGSATTHHSH